MSRAQPSPGGLEEARRLAALGVARVRAPNGGPLTLSGTNTWVLGCNPAYVVDPGPLEETHMRRLLRLIERRGGLGGVALTHDHHDHAEAAETLIERASALVSGAGAAAPPAAGSAAERLGLGGAAEPSGAGGARAPLAAGRGRCDVILEDRLRFGPLQAIRTPGHSPDHFAFVAGEACFTGDAVLGEGSVFIAPDPGALSFYLAALRGLATMPLSVLCPGHGPAVWDPQGKLSEYVEHRLERERALIAALSGGARAVSEMLDAAWPDVDRRMRPLASVTLAAHLEKLEQEGRLPDGVERPDIAAIWGADGGV